MSEQQRQGLIPEYKKSPYSMNEGNCVEARVAGDSVDVRDTQHRGLGALGITPQAWRAFVGVLTSPRAGEH